MPSLLQRLHWTLCTQCGLNLRVPLRSLRALPQYLRDWRAFRRSFDGEMQLSPCLQDLREEGGSTHSEYFWQDLLVAQWIHQAAPQRHVDIGSRVDGFVAHVASFRHIEVLDVRPISAKIPNVTFTQADLMSSDVVDRLAGTDGYCDSLSCLHVLEHFGLGRYGDPVDPDGFRRGFANLVRLLKPGGRLYLSTPMGRERVEFNANWVFAPSTIVNMAERAGMRLDYANAIHANDGPQALPSEELCTARGTLHSNDYRLVVMGYTKATASPNHTGNLDDSLAL